MKNGLLFEKISFTTDIIYGIINSAIIVEVVI